MLYGDVNSDSKIDILDMILLKSYVNDKNTDGFSVKSADVDGDGKISAKDVVELSMYLMNQTQSFSYEASIDTDGDGLSDYVEKELIKTNYLKKDTDNDGLDDYVEVYLCNTDPLNDCKDGSDIKDCDIDSDNDGLKNGDEVNKYGTSPGLTDTDNDGISDYDEVLGKIKSDPLKKDSDDDGISDFGELQLSLDPMKKSSDGKKLDNNRYFEQKLPDEKLLAINTDDNFYNLSVSANLRGYAPESLTVCESSYASMLDEYAVNGMVIDVKYSDEYKDDTGNFNLNLNFELKNCNNPEDYMIFKYVEEFYVLLPVETEWSGNSLILLVRTVRRKYMI